MNNYNKPKEITGEASYKLGQAIQKKKHPDIPNAICPVCRKTFTSTFNNATGRYTRFNSRECARKDNSDKHPLYFKAPKPSPLK